MSWWISFYPSLFWCPVCSGTMIYNVYNVEKFYGFVENILCVFNLSLFSFLYFYYSYICYFHGVRDFWDTLCMSFFFKILHCLWWRYPRFLSYQLPSFCLPFHVMCWWDLTSEVFVWLPKTFISRMFFSLCFFCCCHCCSISIFISWTILIISINIFFVFSQLCNRGLFISSLKSYSISINLVLKFFLVLQLYLFSWYFLWEDYWVLIEVYYFYYCVSLYICNTV